MIVIWDLGTGPPHGAISNPCGWRGSAELAAATRPVYTCMISSPTSRLPHRIRRF